MPRSAMTQPNLSLPPWVSRLRNDADLNSSLELAWLDPDARAALREDWLGVWNQVPYEDGFHADCRQRLARCVPLAQGPVRERRLRPTQSRLVLVHDPEEPDIVFGNLSHAMPSMLWVRAEPGAVLDALRPYLIDPAPAVVDLPRVARTVKILDIDDRAVVANSIDNLELWMDDATWASAHNDDPWRYASRPMGMLDQARWLRETSEEHPDRFPSLSWRTLWSKGVMRLEQHPMGMWVFELRYAPASDGKVIDAVNELLGSRLPRDLPVDLAASLLRGGCLGEDFVEELRARGERPLDQAALTCGLGPAEMSSHETLLRLAREHRTDEDMLGSLADLAARYRHDAVLFEIAALSEGTALGDDLMQFLAPSQPATDGQVAS